jgi:Fic family protein
MAKLLINYNQISQITFEDIIEFHYNFESIHPFQDGNGRVGRMIIFKECLKNGIDPFIIDVQHKLFYYRGLKEFPEDRGYLIDTCYSAQDRYKELLEYFSGE